jgi:hypothetical protein
VTQEGVKIFELDMDQFAEPSPVPMPVRMRLALSKLGMRFVDDGSFGLVVNENPKPLGKAWCWESKDRPHVRMYAQKIAESKS